MPQLSQAVVEQMVALCHGRITTRDIWAELDIGTPENKSHLRVIMDRLVDKGIVRRLTDGSYQRINGECKVIDWQAADVNAVMDLSFPFQIEDYAKIYPKSIVIVAGSKNAGKTAFLYNFIVQNQEKPYIIDLYNSETGPEQMKERFSSFPDLPNPPPFNTYERYDNFADVINPNHISVIDYLDMNSDVYMVGAEIDAIFRKLDRGIAIIAMQKPQPSVSYVHGKKQIIDRDLAYGGAFSAKRSVLYISLSDFKAKLVYVKTPAHSNMNPTNRQWTYKLMEGGVIYHDVKPFIEQSEPPPWYQNE